MFQFFETIKVQNGMIYNLKLHNQRLNHTISNFYNGAKDIDLKNFISPPNDNILYRCKVIYDTKIRSVEFYPYYIREFSSFKIIRSNISYDFKLLDRTQICKLFEKKGNCSDILIVDRNDRLKDTSIANIAIKIDGIWWTPKKPLLKGTMREKLLKDNIVLERDLSLKDIEDAEDFAIMNSMLGFKSIKRMKNFLH